MPHHTTLKHALVALTLLLSACPEDPTPLPPVPPVRDMSQRDMPDAVDMPNVEDMPPAEDMPQADDMAQDIPPAVDMPPVEDMPPAEDMETPDQGSPCDGVDCGAHGRCEDTTGQATCACDPGYMAQGLTCAEIPAAPVFEGLPATVEAGTTQAGSFQAQARDDNAGDTLSFAVAQTTCSFAVMIEATTGATRWTCPAAEERCDATIEVSDGALSDQGVLTIDCVTAPPTFTTAPPTTATEHTLYRHTPTCEVVPGATATIAVGAQDTCGSVLDGTGRYEWGPDEQDGGASCTMHLTCSDGAQTTDQITTLTVTETNTAPQITTAPVIMGVQRGQTDQTQLVAVDSDDPAQALTFSLGGTTCVDAPLLSADGLLQVLYVTQRDTCIIVAQVSDG